jgi:hypothetical protein
VPIPGRAWPTITFAERDGRTFIVQSYYTFIALDLANERSRETQRRRLLDIARASDPEQQRSIRRSTAALVATLSRVSGRLARRLDENANVGEALIGRSMADTCS